MHISLYDVRMALDVFTDPAEYSLDVETAVEALKAVGEPTRLRILAILRHGECSVTDLCEILGQSQPRISRHLKLLVDAGICSRHREGTFVYFGIERDGDREAQRVALTELVLAHLADDDPQLDADLARLGTVRERRSAAADEHFAAMAADWDLDTSRHVANALIEPVLLDMLHLSPSDSLGDVLDVGTGTGRMVQLLASSADRLVGIDTNTTMLRVARANLDRAGVHHAELRHGDLFAPPVEYERFDLVVIHQVLHYLDDPDRAISAIAKVLRRGGRALIVDLAPHHDESLRTEHAHRRLGFDDRQVRNWCDQVDLHVVNHELITDTDARRLAVQIWLAEKGSR